MWRTSPRGSARWIPPGLPPYKANADAYEARLADLDKWVKTEFAAIPKAKRRMITSHDAFGYFGAAYGITIISPMGFSTESEAAAGDIAKLIRQRSSNRFVRKRSPQSSSRTSLTRA